MSFVRVAALVAALALPLAAWAATPVPAPAAKPAAAPAAKPAETPQTFAGEAAANAFCSGTNPTVWYNPESKIYFPKGNRWYGKTKAGGYTCQKFADGAGYRISKN